MMPGYTTKWRLPYLLSTEGIYLIANTTKALADRLDAVLTSGELKGDKGDPGATGPQGPAGATGPAGAQGVKGDTGAAGPRGPAGETGPQGPTGPKGDAGPAGPAGPEGDTGPAGPTGPQGPTGPKGDAGTSLKPAGVVATAADLPTGLGPDDAGIAYTTADNSHFHMWSGTEWADLGPLEGPKGDTGDTGPAGPTGPQGPKGDTGPTGPKGDTGATGPAGVQGPKGDTGPTGATGPAGPAGIQGPRGDTGLTGPKGDTGATGPQGPAGTSNVSAVTSYTAGAAVSIPHNVATAVRMSTVQVNEAGVVQSDTDYRITKAGWYRLTGQVGFAWRNSTAEKRGAITTTINGFSQDAAVNTTQSTNGILSLATGPVYLPANAVVRLLAFHFTGTSLDTLYIGTSPGAYSCTLGFEWLHA